MKTTMLKLGPGQTASEGMPNQDKQYLTAISSK